MLILSPCNSLPHCTVLQDTWQTFSLPCITKVYRKYAGHSVSPRRNTLHVHHVGCCASIVPDKMINARLLTACNSAHQSYLAGTGKPYTFHKVNGTGVFAFPGTRAQDPNDWMTDAEWATAPLEGSGLFQVGVIGLLACKPQCCIHCQEPRESI